MHVLCGVVVQWAVDRTVRRMWRCVCCVVSRAVGSRQNSPTDIETQNSAARLSDSVLLTQQQHAVQLQQQNVAAQLDAASLTSASAAGALTDSFFTTQYMMDTAGFAPSQAPPDYNQQVSCTYRLDSHSFIIIIIIIIAVVIVVSSSSIVRS